MTRFSKPPSQRQLQSEQRVLVVTRRWRDVHFDALVSPVVLTCLKWWSKESFRPHTRPETHRVHMCSSVSGPLDSPQRKQAGRGTSAVEDTHRLPGGWLDRLVTSFMSIAFGADRQVVEHEIGVSRPAGEDFDGAGTVSPRWRDRSSCSSMRDHGDSETWIILPRSRLGFRAGRAPSAAEGSIPGRASDGVFRSWRSGLERGMR